MSYVVSSGMECREEGRECRRDWWSEGDGDEAR